MGAEPVSCRARARAFELIKRNDSFLMLLIAVMRI